MAKPGGVYFSGLLEPEEKRIMGGQSSLMAEAGNKSWFGLDGHGCCVESLRLKRGMGLCISSNGETECTREREQFMGKLCCVCHLLGVDVVTQQNRTPGAGSACAQAHGA